jgi:hypothetical protein
MTKPTIAAAAAAAANLTTVVLQIVLLLVLLGVVGQAGLTICHCTHSSLHQSTMLHPAEHKSSPAHSKYSAILAVLSAVLKHGCKGSCDFPTLHSFF